MNKSLDVRDSLYYSDLIYEIRCWANLDVDVELTRIVEREIDTRNDDVIGTATIQSCCSSSFIEEFYETVRWIEKKANASFNSLSDMSKYPVIVLEALVLLEKKELDNQMLIQLISIIKDMGLEDRFSLGESREQCVCLDKKDNSWEVYIVERGTSFEKSVYEDCFDACVEVINQLADSKQMYEEAKEKFGMVRKLVPSK